MALSLSPSKLLSLSLYLSSLCWGHTSSVVARQGLGNLFPLGIQGYPLGVEHRSRRR